MKVPFADFAPMHNEVAEEMKATFEKVYEKGWFIQGAECARFEKAFAEYCETDFCIGCGNGLMHCI